MSGARHVRIRRERLREQPLTCVELGGHRVVVALREGEPYALADRCPHRGAPLSWGGQIVTPFVDDGGRLVPGAAASHVRCPWHKWDFDLATGRCATDDRLRIRTYHAWVERDEVVVSLDPRAEAAA